MSEQQKKYAKFHAIRITHEAFCKLHAKANEAMINGNRYSLGEIASNILVKA